MIAAPPYGAWLHNAEPNRNSAGMEGSVPVRDTESAIVVGGAIRQAELKSFGGTPVKRSLGPIATGGISCGICESHPLNLPHGRFRAQQDRFAASDLQHDEREAAELETPARNIISNIATANPIVALI